VREQGWISRDTSSTAVVSSNIGGDHDFHQDAAFGLVTFKSLPVDALEAFAI
jgi:hypothetical protein